MLIVIPGRRILLWNRKTDRIPGAMMDAGHTHLAIFHAMNRSLLAEADAPSRTDSGANSTADTRIRHLIKP